LYLTLHDPILVASIDSTEGDCLVGGVNGGSELLGCKNTVITMVMLDNHLMVLSEAFEGTLGFKVLLAEV
jgi:hypothetical protein